MIKEMKCPECDNDMKCIVHEPLTRCRMEQRLICECGAFIKYEYDICEE